MPYRTQKHLRERGPLVLALDIGTSSIRAALYDESGEELRGTQARITRSLCTTIDGGAELDAEESVEQVAVIIDAAISSLPVDATRVETVAVSCFWHSLVGVDVSRKAVTPVLGWADTRAAREALSLRRRFNESETHNRTGAPFHPSYWPAKILWLKDTRPLVYKDVTCWMSFGEFLALRFLDKARASVSMASGTGLFNIHDCVWDEEFCAQLGISAEQLPIIAEEKETYSLAQEYARRWPRLAEARWFPAMGDGAANNIGAGCATPERACLMMGTSGAMRVVREGRPPEKIPHGLWCYRVDRRRVVAGGALSDGGGLWAWMSDTLRLDQNAAATEREVAALEPDAHGLTLLPFWAGERSTGWNPRARGAILGLSAHTSAVEILRASMESVAYRFSLIADALEEIAPGALIVASGGALLASRVWAQMIADAVGRPLTLSGVEESSSRGAVLLALEATGKIKSIREASAPVFATLEPDMARHTSYRRGRERQQKLYRRLVADEETAQLISEAAGRRSED